MSNEFVYTTALHKIRSLKSRKAIIQGGTSSSKTYSILAILIDTAARYTNKEISVVSESYPHLRRGAIKDFIKIMKQTKRYQDSNWNKTMGIYTFGNGSYIEFFSADQEEKLRGARRNILFLNEANNITFDAYYQLAIRTNEDIYIDYNPTHEFWAHTEVADDNDAELIILTYKDNEALDVTIVNEIEKARDKGEHSSYWANWWQVYGLGQVGSLQGVIFENWKVINKIPADARLLGIGMDFGYTNDPTAIVEVYQYNDKRILNEIAYQTGLVNSDIARLLPKDVMVYADSAEPKSIEEIRRHGIQIQGATKGKDSIMFGISLMQEQQYLVTNRSTNLIKEFRAYSWATDKNGAKLNKPIDLWNHLCDSIRYHEVMTLAKQDSIFTF